MKVVCRGTKFQVEIATVFTTLAQVLSLNVGKTASVTKEVECLDDAGFDIEKINLNSISQEDLSGELYFDPANAGHQFLTDRIALGAAGFPVDFKVVMPDTGASEIAGSAVGFGLGLTVAVQEALKASFDVVPQKALTWPT